MTILSRFKRRCSKLLANATISELSGSVGDLGTFVPLYLGMVHVGAVHPTPALFLAGLSNVIVGTVWDCPMCVQPMHSISAVAIADGLTRVQVTAAGVWMGLFLFLLSFGGIEWINRVIPVSVISGIQLGVGTRMAVKGLNLVRKLEWIDGIDCIGLAVVCSLFAMYMMKPMASSSSGNGGENSNWCRRGSAPIGLYLFGIASVVSLTALPNDDDEVPYPTTATPPPASTLLTNALSGIKTSDWITSFLEGAVPQLPLTTLNSVISVCCLARSLYPDKITDANSNLPTRKQVSLSIGIMNLVLCPLGAQPNCHGAGGLAGQHKFGARGGTAVVLLGLMKMGLAIVGSLLGGRHDYIKVFLDNIPVSILGVMLIISGHELACTGVVALVKACSETASLNNGNDSGGEQQMMVLRVQTSIAVFTGAIIVGLEKTHYGAFAGIVAHWIYGDGSRDFSFGGQVAVTEQEYEVVDVKDDSSQEL